MNRLVIIITSVVAFLVPEIAFAGQLSLSSKNTYEIPPQISSTELTITGTSQMKFKVIPKSISTDNDISKCLTISILKANWDSLSGNDSVHRTIDIFSLFNQNLTTGGSLKQYSLKHGEITGHIHNSCNKEVMLEMLLTATYGPTPSTDNLWSATLTVPRSRVCGVELVNDNINFKDVKPGDVLTNRKISFDHFSPGSQIEITSSDMSNHQLKLGNSEDLILTVPTEDFGKTGYSWSVNSTRPTIPLQLTASTLLKTGTYTSNLTVNLSCQ